MLSWRMDLEDDKRLERLMSVADVMRSPAAAFAESDVPDSIDFRPNCRIENQFSIGSCQGNSISTSTEIQVYIDSGVILQLTRMGAYIWSQEKDNLRGDVGSVVASGVEVAFEGLCLEEYWPYPKSYKTQPDPPATRKKAQEMRTVKLKKAYRMRTAEEALTWIKSNQGPLHCGFSWVSSLSNAGKIITSISGRSAGGHSVTLAGGQRVNGDFLPRLFNSHSTAWADNGTALVSLSALDRLFADRNTVVIGVSQSDGIKPPRYDYIGNPVTR